MARLRCWMALYENWLLAGAIPRPNHSSLADEVSPRKQFIPVVFRGEARHFWVVRIRRQIDQGLPKHTSQMSTVAHIHRVHGRAFGTFKGNEEIPDGEARVLAFDLPTTREETCDELFRVLKLLRFSAVLTKRRKRGKVCVDCCEVIPICFEEALNAASTFGGRATVTAKVILYETHFLDDGMVCTGASGATIHSRKICLGGGNTVFDEVSKR